MKKNLFLLLSLLYVYGFSQKYEFTYGKMISTSESELNNIKDISVKNNILEMNKSFDFIEYQLLVDGNNAMFHYVKKINPPNFNKRAITMGGGDGIYYFDYLSNKVIHKTELIGDLYYVEKKIDSYKWIILNETKIINGLICHKAKTDIIYDDIRGKGSIELEVWFCPEIPFPYGPDMFFGLPGLVFEANQKNSKIKFYLKKIESLITIPKIELPKEKTISEEEMNKIVEKVIKDLENQR